MTSKKSLMNVLKTGALSYRIHQSENNKVEASRELLRQASTLLDTGTPLPPELSDWLSSKLKAIADGADPTSALNLTKPRGKPQQYSEEFQREVANFIRLSKNGRSKIPSKDGSKLGAYLEAANVFGINENTAEKFYRNQIDIILAGEDADREIRDENQD